MATAEWREPASSDRFPSIGVSLQPAIPRRVAPQQSPLSASPVTDNSSSVAIQCGNQMRWSTSPHRLSGRADPEGVSFLLCTPGDISILRRHLTAPAATGRTIAMPMQTAITAVEDFIPLVWTRQTPGMTGENVAGTRLHGPPQRQSWWVASLAPSTSASSLAHAICE